MAASGLNRGIGESPITEAQALEAVKFLLRAWCDARGADDQRRERAVRRRLSRVEHAAALLIDKGADVNAVSKAGVTPWLAASGYGDRLGGVLYNKEGADLLLKHGADPEAREAVSGAEQCR